MILDTVPGLPAAATTLPTLLALLPTGVVYYTPVAGAEGQIVDFRFSYLNAAAQHLLGLPAHPAASYLQQWPASIENGAFAAQREAYLAGAPVQFDQFYPAAGYPGSLRAHATRLEDGLLVSLTEQPSAAPASEDHAPADAPGTAVRADIHRFFDQAPFAISMVRGPQLVVELLNDEAATLLGSSRAALLGKPLLEAMPIIRAQGFEPTFRRVLEGETFTYEAIPIEFDRSHLGKSNQGFYRAIYQPWRNETGEVIGMVTIAVEVTEQVLAQQQQQQYSHELEARVSERTHQLEEQQGLLQQLLVQLPAAVATLIGPEHRFAFFNERYAALTSNRAALYQTVASVLPELEEQGFSSLLQQVYESGEPFIGTEISVLLEQPTGPPKQQYLNITYQPLTDRHGHTQGILVFALDVSEQVRTRRQAETLQAAALAAVQRRAQQRQELYQIFAQAPVAIVLLREPDHRIDYFNPAFQELFPPEEWAGGDLHGHALAEVYPRLQLAGFMQLINRVFETGEPQVIIDMPLADLQPGSPRFVTLSYQAYREDGRIAGVAAFAYDVTEQVLARRASAAQQQLVESVFEQSPTAIWVAEGPSYIFSLVNPLMEQILGHTRKQLLGQPCFTVLPELIGQGVPELLNQVWQSGETLFVKELPAQLTYHQPGQPGYFSFVFQPLRDAQGQLTRIACVAIDVTDQVRARQQVQDLNEELASINEKVQATNEELNNANNRLTRTNTDLDTFVYTASHDLKAPISNIEGLLLALRQQLPAEATQAPLVQQLFTMMQSSVARFQQTIGHLTNISQLQQAEVPERVDLLQLIKDIRLDLAPLLETASVALQVAVDGCEAVRVAPKTLRSVVYNLLSNAVKYRSPDRPAQVQLRASCDEGLLTLQVQDNGLGLSPTQQSELFGMFRRLHTHVEGSGVGLFMVKRLVENAGGRISVESQAGVGTTFTVSLPA